MSSSSCFPFPSDVLTALTQFNDFENKTHIDMKTISQYYHNNTRYGKIPITTLDNLP